MAPSCRRVSAQEGDVEPPTERDIPINVELVEAIGGGELDKQFGPRLPVIAIDVKRSH